MTAPDAPRVIAFRSPCTPGVAGRPTQHTKPGCAAARGVNAGRAASRSGQSGHAVQPLQTAREIAADRAFAAAVAASAGDPDGDAA